MKAWARGFTLIELLISFSVVALIAGLGFASFNQFNRRQQVVNAAQALLTDLRLAQSKAQNMEIPPGPTSTDCSKPLCATLCQTNPLVGYQLDFAGSLTTYSLKALCPPLSLVVKTVTFPSGIQKSGGLTSVTFKSLRGGVTFAPEGVTNVVVGSTILTKTINISAGGEISLGDDQP